MTHPPPKMNTKKKTGNMHTCMSLLTDSILFWVPCHHSMARPQVADRGGIRHTWKWRPAANILTKQSRMADSCGLLSWGSGVGRTFHLTINNQIVMKSYTES
jgi:hypothetical protein